MATFSSSRYLLAFFLLNLYLKVTNAGPNLTFSFKNFGNDLHSESQISLFGDAKVVNDSMSVQISGSAFSSAGRVVYRKPINLIEGKSRKMVSFTSYFVFSLSEEKNGGGLAFVMLPSEFPLNLFDGGSMGMLKERKMKFIAVEFDTFKDEKYSDVNGNHIGLDVESPVSVKVSNVSSINLVLNSGEKLQSWVDYEASSKRFEVRLSKLGEMRPLDPLLSYPIDLSQMWKNEEVIVGLSSSSQKSNLYSWSFKSRTMPHWMHSEPMDPESLVGKKDENVKVTKKSDCSSKIVAAVMFGIGCGALGAFLVLFVWTMFGKRRPVVPEEFAVPSKGFEYKKFDVSLDKTIEDDGKK